MLGPEQVDRDVVAKITTALQYAAAFDQRTVGKTDIMAWAMAVGDLPGPEINKAVVAYYADEDTLGGDQGDRRDRIKPFHVRRYVRKQRAARIDRAAPPAITSGDADGFMEQLRRHIRDAGDGQPVPDVRALEPGGRFSDGPPRTPPPEVGAELALLRKRLKPAEATEAAPTPPQAPRHDAAKMCRYEEAKKMLAALPDFGVEAQALAGDQLGAEASVVDVVICAAGIVKHGQHAAAS